MISEKDFEDIICKYPELIENGLILKDRQLTLYGRRMDILFEDKFKRKLIVELKIGPVKDGHIGQILSYEGMLLSAEDPTIRVMLVGNRVPKNIQRSLDHHGIAWKEITISQLKEFLNVKNDKEFLKLFLGEDKQEPSGEQKSKRLIKKTPFIKSIDINNLTGIFMGLIEEALETNGEMTTSALYEYIQERHPDLCDDKIECVHIVVSCPSKDFSTARCYINPRTIIYI